MEIFPVKMTDGCFKLRKYHLRLVPWPGGSCAHINFGSRIFKIGYKKTFGNGEIMAKKKKKMSCVVVLTVCVAIFWDWHSSSFFFNIFDSSLELSGFHCSSLVHVLR